MSRAVELDVAKAQLDHDPALFVQVGRDLVGETGQGPHGRYFGGIRIAPSSRMVSPFM
jgi:hypothetical protein